MNKNLISTIAQQAIEAIDTFKLITCLRNLIRIPSYLGHEDDKADYVSKELERMGVEVQDIILGPSIKRREIFGIIRGDGTGKNLLLDAHLDTNWPVEGQEETAHKAEVEGDKIKGLGVGDSMCALAAFIGALDAVKRSGIKLKGNVMFLASGDELGQKRGAKILEENLIRADACIIGETTGDFDIGVTHTGKVEVEITVKGSMQTLLEGYGEKMGMKPVNAVHRMAKVINIFDEMVAKDPFFHQKHPRLPGEGAAFYIGPVIGGNTGYGSPYMKNTNIPGEYGVATPPPIWCKLRCGARYWPGQTAEEFVEVMKKWVQKVQKAYPGFEATVDCYLDHGNSTIDTPVNALPVKVLQNVITYVRSREPQLIGCVFSTHGPFYMRNDIPTVWTAPGMLRFGRPDEYVTIQELVDCCKIYTASIIEICG